VATSPEHDELGTSPLGTFTAAGGAPQLELHAYLPAGVTTHVLPLSGNVTIGRSRTVEIPLDDPSVSRKHAMIHVGSTILVQDLGSQNGTRVGNTLLAPNTNTRVEIAAPFVVGAISVVIQPIGRASASVDVNDPPAGPRSLRDEVAALERARILEALAVCGGNQTKAAAMLGIPRRTLVLRIEQYAIPRPRK
jgi:hypothetical protein